MLGVVAAVAVCARAEDRLTVYVRGRFGDSALVVSQAQDTASVMFAKADLHIEWRAGRPSDWMLRREGAIMCEITTSTPREINPGAFAAALPFEGRHIRIFYDRVQNAT